MGFLQAIHGEIAGLHSSFYPYSEGGITSITGGASFGKRGVWTYTPRSDARGYGGNYALVSDAFGCEITSSFNESGITGKTAVEFFVRIPFHKAGLYESIFRWMRSGYGRHCDLRVADDGSLHIYTDETWRVSLAGVIPVAPSQWPVLTAWIRIDGTTGWVKVYKNFDYTAPILQYTGNVLRSWGAPANADKFTLVLGAGHSAIDDEKTNDITMSYTGGAGGTIAVGDTITGNVSSSTAIVTRVDGDDVSGTLQLTLLKDGGIDDWNGLQDDDPFAGDASISDGSGWSANLVNAGLDPESSLPGDTYFGPAMLPDSNGFVDGLTESPAQVAGSEWKVLIYNGSGGSTPLGFGPDAEVSYAYATATAQEVLTNLAASAVPVAAMEGIEQLHVYAWAKKDGTGIDNAALSVRSGSTSGYGDTKALGSAFGPLVQRFRENPDTAAAWLPIELATVQAGISFPA